MHIDIFIYYTFKWSINYLPFQEMVSGSLYKKEFNCDTGATMLTKLLQTSLMGNIIRSTVKKGISWPIQET